MTGSRAQLYNGILLLATFFGCRLVWGTYQSLRVYQDVWAALHTTGADGLGARNVNVTLGLAGHPPKTDEMMRFAGDRHVPLWLACTYLGSNVVLNTLNFYWFGKMIETVRKRFQPPKERRGKSKGGRRENGKVEVGVGEAVAQADVGDGVVVGDGDGEEEGEGRGKIDGRVKSETDRVVGKGRVVVERKDVRRRKG